MLDRVSSHPLHKEVLPPQKQPSGFGVVVVAALAMFMAVASSAMVLRTRMIRSACPASHERASPPAPTAVEFDLPADRMRECGTAVYQENPDGSVSVYFDVCPGRIDIDPSWDGNRAGAGAVEVHEIR